MPRAGGAAAAETASQCQLGLWSPENPEARQQGGACGRGLPVGGAPVETDPMASDSMTQRNV